MKLLGSFVLQSDILKKVTYCTSTMKPPAIITMKRVLNKSNGVARDNNLLLSCEKR